MFAFIITRSSAANAVPKSTITADDTLYFKPMAGYTAKTADDLLDTYKQCPILTEKKATLAECTASITCAKTDAASVVQAASTPCADGYTIDA